MQKRYTKKAAHHWNILIEAQILQPPITDKQVADKEEPNPAVPAARENQQMSAAARNDVF